MVLLRNPVKAGTKSILKSSAILVLVFVTYCVAAGSYRSKFAPDDGVDSFAALRLQDVPMTRATRVSNPPDHICVFGDVDSVMWTLPSGPPAYLFDQSDTLIDCTLDVGDSTKFQYEYSVYSGTKNSIAEVEDQFARER
jgi:hypothetical protein